MHLHAWMELLVKHASQLDYPRGDVRGPKDAATFALTADQARQALLLGKNLMFDCSGAVTCVYKWCTLKDPNGLGYKHEGYTGTMLRNLRHYSDAKKARRGALVVFGPGTGEHVAMVMEPDPQHGNPVLFSHGFANGAGPIKLQAEAKYHHSPVTFLDVSGL